MNTNEDEKGHKSEGGWTKLVLSAISRIRGKRGEGIDPDSWFKAKGAEKQKKLKNLNFRQFSAISSYFQSIFWLFSENRKIDSQKKNFNEKKLT